MIARILTAEQWGVVRAHPENNGLSRLNTFACAAPNGDPCPAGRRAIPEDCWQTVLPGGELAALGAALPWLRLLPEEDVEPYHAPEPS